MRRKRRNHLPGFKAKVALAAIKGDRTLAELAEQFDVHQNQVQDWRKQLLDQADTVFGSGQDRKTADEAHLRYSTATRAVSLPVDISPMY